MDMQERNAIPTRTKTELLLVQITIKVKQVRNDESLYDKQIRFASSLLRVVPTKYQTNDVYNTWILGVDAT